MVVRGFGYCLGGGGRGVFKRLTSSKVSKVYIFRVQVLKSHKEECNFQLVEEVFRSLT